MDPNANLQEQRSLAAEIQTIQDECADDGTFTPEQLKALSHHAMRLAELSQALDDWISHHGVLPLAWQRASKPAAPTRCGDTCTDGNGRTYRCRLAPGHTDNHVDTRHPMQPTWRQS